MEGQDFFISLGVLLITIFMASSFMGSEPNIVEAVSDKYPLKTTDGQVRKYSSNNDVYTTINNIVSIKEPYDQKVKMTKESVLLYDEAVVIVRNQNRTTEIEVIEDHKTAYRRHRGTMILFWGNNPYRNGRIGTPRSIRKGSIWSSPSRGGGFGFGK